MSKNLSLLDDSSESEIELTINKDYANRYDQWRHKEELQKYKDLKKDEEDSESSTESEEDSEEFDEEFFRALSLLKGKDPRLYDKNFQLFQSKNTVKKPKAEKQKPVYMKDFERNLVLERGGKFSDEDEENNVPEKVPTYDEEQEKLKKNFKEAVGGSDDSDADELLQVRTKTKNEEAVEEADYVKWLKGEEKEISEEVKRDMSHLRNYWNDPKLDEGEKFLRDYILNKRYLEKDDSEIPTYEELTSGLLSDDEKMIEEQEKFEHKYNFRFEEPDEEFIKRYPRTINDSLRRIDNRRKQKREEKTERKKKEIEQRREELKRLKALKRKEIEEKFVKLKEISGQDEINFNESDIESDFDPDKHDQKMREMFNDEYYQFEEDNKPEFPYDDELDSENWNTWTGEKSVEEDKDNENIISDKEKNNNKKESDANFKNDFANEMINTSQSKKKGKKKSLFAKIISQPKPIYDPDGKSFEDYLDEYYKMDYEDIVGDMPVRYKYRKVIPNDFGLTIEEIFAADDRELNRWCSVKKACQYRNDDEEVYDVQAFRKKAEIPLIKQKCLPSVYAPQNTDDSSAIDIKVTKEKNNMDNLTKEFGEKIDAVQCHEFESLGQTADQNIDFSIEIKTHKKKLKKKKKKLNMSISVNDFEATNFMQNEDENCSNLESSICDDMDSSQNVVQTQEQVKIFKKKKHKKKQNISLLKIESKVPNASKNVHKNLDVSESPVSVNSTHKIIKKKRKHEDYLSISDSKDINSDITLDSLALKFKQRGLSDSGDTANSSINLNLENTCEVIHKKKKKSNNIRNTEKNESNLIHKKPKYKHKQWISEDKRIGLSDKRLAAYGINPKKFKNKIIYSKK